MSITRYGAGSTAGGGQPRPFARAVEADGWLYVSGQVPAVDGEIITGGIIEQTRQTMRNVVAILEEAGYELKDVVRVGVWLEDPGISGVSTKCSANTSPRNTPRHAPVCRRT